MLTFNNSFLFFPPESKLCFQLVCEEGRIYSLEGCKRHGAGPYKTTRADWNIGWCSVCWAGLRREKGAGSKITPKRGTTIHFLWKEMKFINVSISGMKLKMFDDFFSAKYIKHFHGKVHIKL